MSNFRAIFWNVCKHSNNTGILTLPEIRKPSASNQWRSLEEVVPPLNMEKRRLGADVRLWGKAIAIIECDSKSSWCQLTGTLVIKHWRLVIVVKNKWKASCLIKKSITSSQALLSNTPPVVHLPSPLQRNPTSEKKGRQDLYFWRQAAYKNTQKESRLHAYKR